MSSKIEQLESRLAAGDSLGLTLQERDALQARIARARAAKEQVEHETRRSFERFVAPTSTLAELGFGRAERLSEASEYHRVLGEHLEDALAAVKRAKRKVPGTSEAYPQLQTAHDCLRAAQEQHSMMGDALQAASDESSAPDLGSPQPGPTGA